MDRRTEIVHGIDNLIDHYMVISIFMALFILTWVGVGDVPIVCVLGLILCAAGCSGRCGQTDLRVLIPLVVYDLANMASSYAAYGNITDGYGALHLIFPVLYLLMSCLEKGELLLLRRLCVVWAGITAAAGIISFVFRAVTRGSAARLGGFLGNPNALGIFLVVGWFLLMNCLEEQHKQEEQRTGWYSALPYAEPVLLIGLALTLSMGSFVAMAAGISAVLIMKCTGKKAELSVRETARFACRILARASLGVGTGILFYLAASRTSVPQICLLLFVYAAAVVILWRKYDLFLQVYPKMAAGISAVGILVAGAAVVVRPSSVATFSERLQMMRNGIGYLTANPLLGVGPYQWRILNLQDRDIYFNTWHIHNVLIHVGVEFGWIAMGMLILVAAGFFRKKAEPWRKAGFTAFCIHNMMDTGFFYLGITTLVMLAFGNPSERGKGLKSGALKICFGVFAAFFAFHLCFYAVHFNR